MRTTLNLHKEALALSKARARQEGKSLGEVVSEAVFSAFRDRPTAPKSTVCDPPVSGEGGVMPGIDLDNTSELLDQMRGLRHWQSNRARRGSRPIGITPAFQV